MCTRLHEIENKYVYRNDVTVADDHHHHDVDDERTNEKTKKIQTGNYFSDMRTDRRTDTYIRKILKT